MGIESWSTTAASNSAAPPNGAPEGCAPSSINDTIRQCMAAIRAWYEDAQWANFGHSPVRIDNDTFTVATDLTALYHAGRRLKVGGSATAYCTVASSSYSAPDTTVNVTIDSGNLPATLSTVYLSILTATNGAIPGPVLLPFGSVASPAYSYQGDADTGTARTATDQMSHIAGGLERHRIDAAFGNSLQGGFRLPSVITPTQIAANQNDYSPSGIDTCSIVRLASGAAFLITGIQTPNFLGRILLLANVGSFNLTLSNQHAGSAAQYRFAFGADIVLGPDDGITLWYDVTSQRWRSVGVKL